MDVPPGIIAMRDIRGLSWRKGIGMRVIDMHCDTICELVSRKARGKTEGLRENKGHVDLARMRESHYMLQNFALFVMLEKDGDPWERVCCLHRRYMEELERNQDILAPVLRFSDIARNEAAGKISAMLTVEEGGVCKGELGKLRQLHEMGVRMLTLTWNYRNEIGCPNFNPELKKRMGQARTEWRNAPTDDSYRAAREAFEAFYHTPNVEEGLSEKGREMVAEMERLGMIPDVSHLSDQGFYDVLEATGKPFVASHSNARAVCPCVRNLTDDMIRKLSERGGIMGLNFCADFLEEKPFGVKNPGTIASVVRHAKHIAAVGGMDVLGLGSDFDGIDTNEELPGVQGMERLWDALHKEGFGEGDLDKIFYRNVLRVYQDTI